MRIIALKRIVYDSTYPLRENDCYFAELLKGEINHPFGGDDGLEMRKMPLISSLQTKKRNHTRYLALRDNGDGSTPSRTEDEIVLSRLWWSGNYSACDQAPYPIPCSFCLTKNCSNAAGNR